MQNHTKGIIYAAITAFFWGFLAVALKIADPLVTPVTLVWFRFAIAFILLSAVQMVRNRRSFRILVKPPLLLLIASLGLSWNYLGYMFGIHYTTPSNAQLFIQTGPIILATAGFVFFKEKLTRNQIVGFAITLLGFSFFYRDQLSAFFETQEKYNLGILLTLSGALAWSVYAILQKQLVVAHPVENLNLFLFGFPVLLYSPFVDLTPMFHLHWSWWLLMLFLGLNTFIAYTCIAKALKYLEANKVSVIVIMNPIITFITMAILTHFEVSWIIHERFSPVTFAGALLVFSGAFLVVRKSGAKSKI
ncbi:MAG: DMT family transporter [Bacteroidia bacterium]|nr:DMT family transporter [Bacteroidia bacterium]